MLRSKATIWSPEHDIESVFELVEALHELVLRRQPSIVHLGAGIKDTRPVCVGSEVPLMEAQAYRAYVSLALATIQERSTTLPIWSTITPFDERSLQTQEGETSFRYDNSRIVAYNEQGKGAAQALGVGVNDLYGSVKAASRHESIRRDGFALGSEGLDLVAERIARAIEQAL